MKDLKSINPLLNLRGKCLKRTEFPGKLTAVACVTDKVKLKTAQSTPKIMREKSLQAAQILQISMLTRGLLVLVLAK